MEPVADDRDWHSYVGRTRHNYIRRYVNFARDENANYDRLEEELANLLNATEQAWALHAYPEVLQVADSLWCSGGRFLDYRGHARDGIAVLTRAVDAARTLQDQARQEVLLGQLGRAWMAERDWPAARDRFEEALSLARDIGDRQGEASHLGNLGQILLELAQKEQAARHFQMALNLAREIGDVQIEGRVSASLGLLRLSSGTRADILEATGNFEAALGIARQIGDRRGEVSHLGCLGLASELLSRGLSLETFVMGPDPGADDERRRRYNRELEWADQDSLWKAIEYYRRALAVAHEIGDEQMEKKVRGDEERVHAAFRQRCPLSAAESTFQRVGRCPVGGHPASVTYYRDLDTGTIEVSPSNDRLRKGDYAVCDSYHRWAVYKE
jgi:tetratricopeptide (TPR) repeat protein